MACVVWVDYTPDSVKHAPHMMRIGDNRAIAVTLKRLHAFFADEVGYFVVCWRDRFVPELEPECRRAGAGLFVTDAPNAHAAIRAFCERQEEIRTIMLFAANGVLTDCALAGRMIEKHISERADLTLASTLPPGIAPAAIIDVPAIRGVGPGAGDTASLGGAVKSLALCSRRTDSGGPLRVLEYGRDDDAALELDRLPESALVTDEPGRLAAERAIQEHPDELDSRTAYAFKRIRIASDERPRPLRRANRIPAKSRTVLFSSLQPAFSGGEQSLYTLIANLRRDEFQPITVFPFETTLADMLELAGVPVEIAGWDYTTLQPGNLSYCSQLLEEFQPSIVHVDGFLNPALMTVAHLRRIPIVGHLRVFTGGRAPAAIRLADRIITVSDAIKRDVRRNDIDPERVIRIYNGVSFDRLSTAGTDLVKLRSEHAIPEQARVISLIARITPFKRLDLLIEALPEIVAAEPRAHAVIAGEPYGQDLDYYQVLRTRVGQLGLERHVTWWGFEPQIGRIYAISELLVHCNRHEPLARCMLEALACGVPLIGPRDGGSCEVIEHGRNGLLFEPDSVEGLAAAVKAALNSDEERLRMAKAARVKSMEFSVDRHVTRVQELYRSLLPAAFDEGLLEAVAHIAG